MNFNFGTVGTEVSGKRLAAWGIYDVKFDGCRAETIKGKKDPTQEYHILKTRFVGKDGYFESSIFYPEKESDTKRNEYTNKEGKTVHFPSALETAEYFIAQLISTLSPDAWEKFKSVSPKCKSFDDVVTVLVKLTDPLKGTETQLKLVGRTKDGFVEAILPNFVAISKTPNADGVYNAYMSDRFIGNNLAFSDYELGKAKETKDAKPTKMEDNPDEKPTEGKGSEDIDFNSLLD